MGKAWTAEELQAASAAMEAAGEMSFEEFCAEMERQIEKSCNAVTPDDA